MPEFTYQALDKSGKTTTGTIAARDSTDAAVKVRALGVFPTRIGTGNGAAATNGTHVAETKNGKHAPAAKFADTSADKAPVTSGKKLGRLLVLLFTREMADLLDAGLPMDRAFSVLIDQTDNEPMKAMLVKMQGEIRAGQPLSEALSKYPREFPPLYSNMVRAGEVSGQLAAVMTRLADFMEKEAVRRSQVMAALSYPMVLVAVAVSAVIFLLTFIIPKLSGVFSDLGNELPLPTVLLLGLSAFIIHYWWAIILTVVGIVVSLRNWLNTASGARVFDDVRMKMPYFGLLAQKIVAARLARTLGTLLAGGVPILESLDITASALGNVVATEALIEARNGVRQGEMLNESMSRTGTFLPVVMHMTAVGEETGRLPAMLIRTSETLDFEVDTTMRKLTSMLEPLIVVVMGAFVGFVVLSILLPIFKVNSLAK
jgi:type II secretory pathway component PulF